MLQVSVGVYSCILLTDNPFLCLCPTPLAPPLQPPGHHLPLVPEPAESHPLPGVQPLQVADHQDRAGAAAAHHAGPLPLQHAGIPGQKDAGRLRRGVDGWRGGRAGRQADEA